MRMINWGLLLTTNFCMFLVVVGVKSSHEIERDLDQLKVQRIINLNSEIIDSIGLTAATQSMVTADLLKAMISIEGLKTGGAKDQVMLDAIKAGYIIEGVPKDGEENIPKTLEQAILDLKEINRSIEAIWRNNLRQKDSTNIIYKYIDKQYNRRNMA